MKRFTEDLGREVSLRPETSDEQTWTDTFVFRYHVPPERIMPSTVLDLGANIGLTAAHYQAMWPYAKVHAVEMDFENALVCRVNFPGPLTVAAIGATTGKATYSKGPWAASYSLRKPGPEKTRVIALAEMIDHVGEKVDFCKMDIEGTEWDLFAEPDGWAERVSSLLVELHGDKPSEEMIGRATPMLERAGFTVQAHTIHPHSLWATR